MPNRLIHETSPYLLQHANNPVEWYPWGPEALERAKAEDKPILLSIGYSACHWCHVMERESFENDAIAQLMNERFISIKVDREERPDLDAVYMEAVQMLTGSGGWPMTVFLTPDTKPFYGGTYFPPVDRQSMPGFPRLLLSVSEAYRNNPDEIERVTNQLSSQMGRSGQIPKGNDLLTEDIMHQAYSTLATNFDYQNGGVGTAPKFPQPMTLEFLLRFHQRSYPDLSKRALDMVNLTLEKMAYGGIGLVQMLTGSGGWPMTVFLTPDTKPFYGGTYFPPVDRQSMPGFPRLLLSVSEAYRNNPDEIERVTNQLSSQMGRSGQIPKGNDLLTEDIMHQAYSTLATNFDYQNGGVGTAPKFPQPMTLEFLLRFHQRSYPDLSKRALDMVNLTLEKMAYGGIYDQIGGGFHRYSTDPYWLVPHFEKMLYDNALLAKLYLHGFLVTQRPLYRRIAQETLDYVLREMTDPMGGFYSSQDADSEGEEGKFFVWTPDETREVLGDETGNLVGGFFGTSEAGNFEGKTIFNVPQAPDQFAQEQGIPLEQLMDTIQSGKGELRLAREQRIHPMRDDKVLSSWNGLMLRALAEAAQVLDRPDYLDAAVKNAEFLTSTMVQDGRLLRTYRNGEAKLLAYLEDYAFVADGLLALYEATFHSRWLEEAVKLADSMIDLFWDDDIGGFYDTGSDHEDLVVRPRDTYDNAQPCGGSVASDILLRLAVITGKDEYSTKAAAPLRALQQLMSRSPMGAGHWLGALDFYLSQPKEIAIIGPRDDPATGELLDAVFGRFLPNKVVVGAELPQLGTAAGNPLLEGREMTGGRPTAYVCQNYVCQLPVTDPQALVEQLLSP